MAKIEELADRVRQHWLSQNLRLTALDKEKVTELTRSAPAGLPEEYETFLRTAGIPDEEDHAGFRFWKPDEVRPTSEVLGAAGYTSHAAEPSIIIADYFQESWWYGLWVAGPFKGQISLVLGSDDGSDPQPPLGTFADFLLAYLQDDIRLYPST